MAKGGVEGDVGNVDVGDSYCGTLEACGERRPSNRKLLRAEMGVSTTMGERGPWLLGRVPWEWRSHRECLESPHLGRGRLWRTGGGTETGW